MRKKFFVIPVGNEQDSFFREKFRQGRIKSRGIAKKRGYLQNRGEASA
jgi:hypothetical protein